MKGYEETKMIFGQQGFAVLNGIFSTEEVEAISGLIQAASAGKPAFRKKTSIFAIRQFLHEIPEVGEHIFTDRFCQLVNELFGKDYFVVKSIYFDKPPDSNWFVSYHQDLTIAVDQKAETDSFSCWTVKQHQYAVHPPISFLQNNFTVRIHLDDTDKNNGALKVIPGSHLKAIIRSDTMDASKAEEQICEVKKGGLMLMRPLLLHASDKTINA